jgi:hypothetical protein
MAKMGLKAAKTREIALRTKIQAIKDEAVREQLAEMLKEINLRQATTEEFAQIEEGLKAAATMPATAADVEAAKKNLESGGATAAPKPEPKNPPAAKPAAKAPKQVNFEETFEPKSKGVYRYVRATVKNSDGQYVTKETVVRAATGKAAQAKAVAWARSQGADKPTERLIYSMEQMDYTPNVLGASGPVRADQMAQEASARLQALRAKNKDAPELYTPVEKQAFEDRKKQKSDQPRKRGSTTRSNATTAASLEGGDLDEAGRGANLLRAQRLEAARNDLKARINAAPEEWDAFVQSQKGKKKEELLESMATKMAADPDRLDDAGKQILERAKNNMLLVKKGADGKQIPVKPNFGQAYKFLGLVPATNVAEVVSKGRRGSKTKAVVNEAKDYLDSAELRKLIGDKTGNEARAIRVKYLAEQGAFDSVNQEGARARILDIIDDPESFAALSKDNNAMSVLEKYGKASTIASRSVNADEYGRIVLSQIDYALKPGLEGAGQRLLEVDEKVRKRVLKTNGSLKAEFLGGTGPERTQRAIANTMSRARQKERIAELETKQETVETLFKKHKRYSEQIDKNIEKGMALDSREMRNLRDLRATAVKDIMLLSDVAERQKKTRMQGQGNAVITEWFEQQKLVEALDQEADPAKKKVLQDRIAELDKTIASRGGGLYKIDYSPETIPQSSLKGKLASLKRDLALAEKGKYSRGRGKTGDLAKELIPQRVASLKSQIATFEAEALRRKDPAKAAAKAAEVAAAKKAAEEAAKVAEAAPAVPAAPAAVAAEVAGAAAVATPTGPKPKASALTSGAWKKGPKGAGRSATALKAVKSRAAGMGIGRGAGVAARMSPLMRVLGPLGLAYGAYELTSAMRERTIGDADRQRLQNLEALSAVSGGVEQDIAARQQMQQMRQFVDLAGIERQRQVDEMRSRYSDQAALDAILRGHEASLAALAQPSRPSIAEMMARM